MKSLRNIALIKIEKNLLKKKYNFVVRIDCGDQKKIDFVLDRT